MKTLTKKALRELVLSARKYGHYHDQATGSLWNKCPLCAEKIECQDYTYDMNVVGRRSTLQMLDAGMSDHIENYCSECPECYALRGGHEDGCTIKRDR